MNKKILIPVIILILLLAGGVVWLSLSLNKQKQQNEDMAQLAAIDKKEMENEYQQFANQYSEMKTQISNACSKNCAIRKAPMPKRSPA